ncbi:MAG: ferritin family protein [Desulfofustis sp.]|nr:ferritin family protein [Desulfofustis sp.]
MNVQKIYEYALQREEEGYQFFKNHADNARHAVAAEVFAKLADEESKHIVFIKRNMGGTAGASETDDLDLVGDGWFEQRARTELLDQSLLESMIPDVAVLRTAFLIEHDLAEFYEMAARRTTGKNQRVFQQLAAWERSHEALFKELHDRVFQQYTEMPWGG